RAGTCGPFPPRYGRTRLEVITGRQEVPHVPHHRGRPGRFAREQGRGRVGGPRGPAARSSAAPAARPRAGGGGRGRLAAPGKLTRGRSLERAERGGRGAAAAAHRRRGRRGPEGRPPRRGTGRRGGPRRAAGPRLPGP